MQSFPEQIFEVAPTFIMVDIQKAAGDASEYLKVRYWKLFYIIAVIELIGICYAHC